MNIDKKNDGGTCFFSPHPDDIVMSGLFVIKEEILPRPYFLFTIFGQSEYVAFDKRRQYPKATITDVRLSEDQKFADKLVLNYLFLKEDDSLKRLGQDVPDEDFPLDTVLIKHIHNSIRDKISSLNICNFVVSYPYGRHQHYDHRIVKVIAEKVSDEYDANLYYLDDIPYSIARPEESIDVLYEKTLSDEDLNYKYQLMRIYESQMCVHYYKMVQTLNRERLFNIKRENR